MDEVNAHAEVQENQQPVSSPSVQPLNQSVSVTPAQVDAARCVARILSGANWFFWIAVLSIVYSFISAAKGDVRFIVGLGITAVIDMKFPIAIGNFPMLVSILVAGVFVFFGIFARKAQLWAFITGMALYALDAVLLLIKADYFSVAFHILVIYFLVQGMAACFQLLALMKSGALTSES